jgi:hypothetical protein
VLGLGTTVCASVSIILLINRDRFFLTVSQNSKSKENWIWRAPVPAIGCLNPGIGIKPEPKTGLIWETFARLNRLKNSATVLAKILCALKIARFPAATAAPSRLSLPPRAPRICPGEPARYTCIYKDGKIDGRRPRRACRVGLVLAPDADAPGRRVVDVTIVPRRRPINRNMARSYNRTWRESGDVIDFKVGQRFGEPHRSVTPCKSPIQTRNLAFRPKNLPQQ